MKRIGITLIASLFVLLQVPSAMVRAEIPLPASVVINEIQTNGAGSGTTLEEFIELVNVSAAQLDISNYKVVYTNSAGKSFDLVVFGIGTILNPGSYALLVPISPTNSFLPDISPKYTYIAPSSSGIAASGGRISIVNAGEVEIDSVQWTNTQATAVNEVLFYAGDGKSLARKILNGAVLVSGSSKNDFEVLATPTPQSGDLVPSPVPDPVPDPIIDSDPVPVDQPTDVPVVADPDPQVPLEPPITPLPELPPVYNPLLLNELYIDPVSPETDANDEWVELYNPSDEAVDASGYVVFTGTNYSYKYIFPAGTIVSPGEYVTLTSGATPLSLSNGGGSAKIVSPDAQVFDTVTYIDAPAGQAWAKNSAGTWEWTTTSTEGLPNSITTPLPPAIKAVATAAIKAKKAAAPSTNKVTAVKAATTKAATKPKAVSSSNNFDDPALISAPMPIPAWLLAVLIALAVLYVGYEYRFEAANSLYRFKKYRSARR